jgi:hypothetical protein
MAMTPRGTPTPTPIFVWVEEEEEDDDDDDDDVAAAGDEDFVDEEDEEDEESPWAVSVGMEVAEEVLLLVAEGGIFFEPGVQEYQFLIPPLFLRLSKALQSMAYLLVALISPSTVSSAGKDRLVHG